MQSVSTAQLPRHAVAPQTNGAHDCVTTAGHEPAPVQLAAAVATPLAHEAARHCEVGYVHDAVSVPLHEPPHALPSVAHAERGAVGAPVTAEHVPCLPTRLHAAHCAVHAVSQQLPSTQKFEAHWLADVHDVPLGLLPRQRPAAQ